MNEEQARQYYITLKTVKKNLSELNQAIADIDTQTAQIQESKHAINEYENITAKSDLLVPIADGIFIQASAVEDKYLRINVGAGAVVKKTPAQAQEMLQEQHDELSKHREQLLNQREQLKVQADDIQKKIAEEIQ